LDEDEAKNNALKICPKCTKFYFLPFQIKSLNIKLSFYTKLSIWPYYIHCCVAPERRHPNPTCDVKVGNTPCSSTPPPKARAMGAPVVTSHLK